MKVEPITDPGMVKAIAEILRERGEKYYVLFMIGIYTGLRVRDILKLRVENVKYRDVITLIESKTKKHQRRAVNPKLSKVLDDYCKNKQGSDFLIPSDNKRPKMRPLSRQMAYYALKQAGREVGLDQLGTHTMRKTFGYHMYKKTGNVAMLMKLFNHSDASVTLIYIGVDQERMDDAVKKLAYD